MNISLYLPMLAVLEAAKPETAVECKVTIAQGGPSPINVHVIGVEPYSATERLVTILLPFEDGAIVFQVKGLVPISGRVFLSLAHDAAPLEGTLAEILAKLAPPDPT